MNATTPRSRPRRGHFKRIPSLLLALPVAVSCGSREPAANPPTTSAPAQTLPKRDFAAGVPQRTAIGAVTQGLGELSEAQVAELGLPDRTGVVLTYTHKDGPAMKAGLRPGDVIRELGGSAIADDRSFTTVLRGMSADQDYALEYWRAGQVSQTTVHLEGAAAVYQGACDGGDPEACFSFGAMLRQGDSVAVDIPAAIGYLETGCSGGSGAACVSLGVVYEHGEGGTAVKLSEAAASYEKACDQNIGPGCFNLARWLTLHGETYQDNLRASSLWERVCGWGDAEACVQSAAYAEDKQKALALYRAACEFGRQQACAEGERLAEREKVAEERVARWTRDCDLGNAEACANLSGAYAWGEGVTKNLARATVLARVACDAGFRSVCLSVLHYEGHICTWEFKLADKTFRHGSDASPKEACQEAARQDILAACAAEGLAAGKVAARISFYGGRARVTGTEARAECGAG